MTSQGLCAKVSKSAAPEVAAAGAPAPPPPHTERLPRSKGWDAALLPFCKSAKLLHAVHIHACVAHPWGGVGRGARR